MVLDHSRRDPWTVQEQMRPFFGEDVSFRSLTTSQSSSSCRTRQRKCGAPIPLTRILSRPICTSGNGGQNCITVHTLLRRQGVWTCMLATLHGIGFPPALSKRRLLFVICFSILPACRQTSSTFLFTTRSFLCLETGGR